MALALVCVVAQGCLIPQSVDLENTRPHTIPRVDTVSMPNFLLQPMLVLDPGGPADASASPPCHCQLHVGPLHIIADDPTVDVQVRIFVDYDLNVTRSQSPLASIILRGTFNSSDTTRVLDSPNLPLFDSSNLGGPGIHVVELVSGEAAGFSNDISVFPPNRAMLPTFESSTFKFVVKVLAPSERDPSRPDCSSTPPLPPPQAAQQRVCGP
ncbi:MAG TPA: hypothetical protein VE964_14430 [Myxococcales bacterium]|nr:hypothetical protein [Myxococcales bacterium]